MTLKFINKINLLILTAIYRANSSIQQAIFEQASSTANSVALHWLGFPFFISSFPVFNINGRPELPPPMTMTLALFDWLNAKVASIPRHLRYESDSPLLTIS